MEVVEAVSDFRCANCDTPLKEVFPGSAAHNQFIDALEFQIHVGYGMFIDQGMDQPGHMSIVVCKDCALGLVLTIPAFGFVMKQYLGERYQEILLDL